MKREFILKNGARVLARPTTVDDYETVQRYCDLIGEQTIFTNQYPGQPWKTPEAYAKNIDDKNILSLAVFDGDRMIGLLGVFINKPGHPWLGRTCSFGVHMLNNYYGLGLGGLLMDTMEEWAKSQNMHRIEGTVRHKNMHGILLYLKKGFLIEGMHKDCAFINNEWHDEYTIAKILD